jgi:ATP-dependent Lon protease
MDDTTAAVKFGYSSLAGEWSNVTTLEEDEYPGHYHRRALGEPVSDAAQEPLLSVAGVKTSSAVTVAQPEPVKEELFQGQRDFQENQRGVSYELLLMPYLVGATEIELHDPYIRMAHQGRNLVELLAAIAAAKDPADEVTFRLFTVLDDDPEHQPKQLRMLSDIVQGAAQQGINVDVAKDPGGHDRWIRTDSGWRINLDVSLDPASGLTGRFYYQSSHPNPPGWVADLNPVLTAPLQLIFSASASGLLVLETSGRHFAITFGYGKGFLDPAKIQRQLGLLSVWLTPDL